MIWILLFCAWAEARVDARYLSFIGVINITDRVMGKVTDEDPQKLYALLNVEEREESGRVAKKIELADKKLTIICTKQEPPICSILIKVSSQGIVSPSKGIIRFVALGQEGQNLRAKFFPNQRDGSFLYTTEDQSVRIAIDDGAFIAEYKKP